MVNNPLEELTLVSVIYAQTEKLMHLYPKTIMILLKSKLLEYADYKEIRDLINEFEVKSANKCLLDVDYSYLPVVSNKNVKSILLSLPLCIIQSFVYGIMFVFDIRKQIFLTNGLNYNKLDRLDSPKELNKDSESYRVCLTELPDHNVDSLKFTNLQGFILAYDDKIIYKVTFDNAKEVLRLFEHTQLAQLTMISSRYLILGLGKYDFMHSKKVFDTYEIYDMVKQETVFEFEKNLKLVKSNIDDFEVVFPNTNEFLVHLVTISSDECIKVWQIEMHNKFEMKLICCIPAPGIEILPLRAGYDYSVDIDKLFFHENIQHKILHSKYKKSILRFCIAYKNSNLCIFDIFMNNDQVDYKIGVLKIPTSLDYSYKGHKPTVESLFGDIYVAHGIFVYNLGKVKHISSCVNHQKYCLYFFRNKHFFIR